MKFQLYAILLLFPFVGLSQNGSFFVPINIDRAYQNETRSKSGKPGKNYWQNTANYKMKISFDPTTRILKGNSEITYFNNSPDTLNEIAIHTFPNIFRKGSARDRDTDPKDLSEGLTYEKLKIGDELFIGRDEGKSNLGSNAEATFSKYTLEKSILPGQKIAIEVAWHYVLNHITHLRTGQTSDNAFMIAYFFPKIAVYDDIDGWNTNAYTGHTEFYNDFGNYEVEINVPKNYLVWASGTLKNPSEVLQQKYAQRFEQTQNSDQKIAIVDTADFDQNITKDQSNSWKYEAVNVPDFAFATAKGFIWEARTFSPSSRSDKKLTIHTAYHPKSKDFESVNQFTKESIEFMANVFPKVDFPYENHTIFNGLGMMEYPGMANNISFTDVNWTRWLAHHETFHSYFPFLTGLNESKYAWLDEGLTMYGTNEFLKSINSPLQNQIGFQGYIDKIGHDSDFPIFSTSKYLKNPVYFNNSYPKTTAFFIVLNDYLGREKFTDFLNKFVTIWKGKHPTALDFLFLLDNATAEDLTWFVKPWLFEFGYVDLGIEGVETTVDGYNIKIVNKGNYPVPVYLSISYSNGETEKIHKQLDIWKGHETIFDIPLKTDKKIERLILEDLSLIDANLKNNVFSN